MNPTFLFIQYTESSVDQFTTSESQSPSLEAGEPHMPLTTSWSFSSTEAPFTCPAAPHRVSAHNRHARNLLLCSLLHTGTAALGDLARLRLAGIGCA